MRFENRKNKRVGKKNLVQKMVKSGAMETVGSCAGEGFVQLKIKLLKCFLISKKKKILKISF